ncbi:MAG: energy-coupling factor transporter ATPase [Bacilli bacterium]
MSEFREPLIVVQDVSFSYKLHDHQELPVFQGISLTVNGGEYVAVIGHNGCGKSTLAKHLNGLLTPSAGNVWVAGMNTKDRELRKEIRKRVGMVFQSPDNQIVATMVEDDVAFGLENIGVPEAEMTQRVDEALAMVGMTEFRQRPPHFLSGGQKQRVAIAGILAMRPQCVVLDEATSMLDSIGRREVLDVIDRLHRQGMAIVAVTHHMSEVARADRVLVMEAGRVVMEGSPRDVFMKHEELRALQLDVPEVSRLARLIHDERPYFPSNLIRAQELVAEVESVLSEDGKVRETS